MTEGKPDKASAGATMRVTASALIDALTWNSAAFARYAAVCSAAWIFRHGCSPHQSSRLVSGKLVSTEPPIICPVGPTMGNTQAFGLAARHCGFSSARSACFYAPDLMSSGAGGCSGAEVAGLDGSGLRCGIGAAIPIRKGCIGTMGT